MIERLLNFNTLKTGHPCLASKYFTQPENDKCSYTSSAINERLDINVIFRGDKSGHTPSQRRAYCKEVYHEPIKMHINLIEVARSQPRNSLMPNTFIEDEAKWLHHPYFDTLVVDL